MSFLDFLKVQRQGLEGLATVGVIGLHMVSGPIVGVAIGYFLDEWLGTGPWLKLVFLVVGIGAGFLNVYVDTRRLVSRLNRERSFPPPEKSPSPDGESEDGSDRGDGRA